MFVLKMFAVSEMFFSNLVSIKGTLQFVNKIYMFISCCYYDVFISVCVRVIVCEREIVYTPHTQAEHFGYELWRKYCDM